MKRYGLVTNDVPLRIVLGDHQQNGTQILTDGQLSLTVNAVQQEKYEKLILTKFHSLL